MKIGVVIVTHYQLGEQMLQALHSIIPKASDFYAVSVSPDQTVDEMRAAISEKLAEAENGQGVLILTDMFGGTPSNIALSFLGEMNVEVVTGINLPMLIKLATLRDEKSLEDLATFIKDYGQRNISVASKLVSESES
ncbi:MAG: PTS sugar transporter subunit IIA [Myxococcales bacterium]|nr:PTS sugar transporter subunit IIA [Myxococcales bacterium]MCH7866179.1 PTS sugar transporter subunit IIA [Myxococcales bacterium]